MKRLLYILVLITQTFCTKAQVVGIIATPETPVLIVFGGESNSGGIADNSFASGPELAVRNLKILNNTTLASFDALNVGTNNLTGHVGLNYASGSAHGLELQLANRYDDGDFGNRAVYLCKAGQGGTTIAMWADEATYSAESQIIEPFDTFIERVQAAIALIETETGETPDVYIFWSLGINDFGAGTSAATFKTNTKNVFAAIRTALGSTVPIFATQFQFVTGVGTMTTYNTALTEIASEISAFYVVSTAGAETTQSLPNDGNHLGYTGMKQVSDDLIDLLISTYL